MEEIIVIRSQFPFTIEDKISDDEWVTEERVRLQNEIDLLTAYENELEVEYLSLTNGEK